MPNPYRCLMVQGTTSDAGKSTLVTGLCRVFARRGLAVAPFKPQNMALNSAVTADGGEIGRAQAVQAQAAGVPTSVHMNPVLLKPSSDCDAQVIIQGRALSNMEAVQYHDYKQVAKTAVMDSLRQLATQYSPIVAEGAGSPAEINLREGDIANMGFAEEADCPVIIIADIDKGGVFAHLVGTLQLLSPSEQARVKGFVINRFRGNFALLEPGLKWLEHYTQKPVIGTLPFLKNFHLEAEDAIDIYNPILAAKPLNIVVPVLPHISNHTDFDALRMHPQINLRFVSVDEMDIACDVILLPGSKSVRQDLAVLLQQNWDKKLQRHLRYGGKILGICGGMQMLGKQIHDPLGIEGEPGSSDGFGFFDYSTELAAHKQLHQIVGSGVAAEFNNANISGYEIHAGCTQGPALSNPLITLHRQNGEAVFDGAISADNQIAATYVHGLFDEAEFCGAFLRWAGVEKVETQDYRELREKDIERLADMCEEHLDIGFLLGLLDER